MVNFGYAVTYKEQEEINQAVEWFQTRLDKAESEANAHEQWINRPASYKDLIELYQEFENRNIESIAEIGTEIGLMAKIKETFMKENRTCQYAEYFIRVYGAEIEGLYGEIEQYREKRKEFERLPR